MKISIIIPVYNSEKYVARCINSILAQTYSDFELILINDGSKDNSLDVLKNYEQKDKRIKVINQKNMGVAVTRNKGIELASGEYIALIDNDDYLDSTYLEEFISKSDGFDVVVGGYKRVSEDKILFTKKITNLKWSKYENVAPWGKIIRRQFLLDNNIKFFSYSIGEDIIFNMDLYTLTDKVKIIDSCSYNWFFNTASVSNTSQKVFNSDILILFEKMKEHDRNEETKYFISRYFVWYLLFSGRDVSSKDFVLEYEKVKTWLIENNYYDKLSFFSVLKNEPTLKNKIIILVFVLVVKLRLIGLFARFYCRGEN